MIQIKETTYDTEALPLLGKIIAIYLIFCSAYPIISIYMMDEINIANCILVIIMGIICLCSAIMIFRKSKKSILILPLYIPVSMINTILTNRNLDAKSIIMNSITTIVIIGLMSLYCIKLIKKGILK